MKGTLVVGRARCSGGRIDTREVFEDRRERCRSAAEGLGHRADPKFRRAFRSPGSLRASKIAGGRGEALRNRGPGFREDGRKGGPRG